MAILRLWAALRSNEVSCRAARNLAPRPEGAFVLMLLMSFGGTSYADAPKSQSRRIGFMTSWPSASGYDGCASRLATTLMMIVWGVSVPLLPSAFCKAAMSCCLGSCDAVNSSRRVSDRGEWDILVYSCRFLKFADVEKSTCCGSCAPAEQSQSRISPFMASRAETWLARLQ